MIVKLDGAAKLNENSSVLLPVLTAWDIPMFASGGASLPFQIVLPSLIFSRVSVVDHEI
jgi:hypothetical protein